MRAWQTLWSIILLFAGLSFALITLVVAIKGFEDLRYLFRRLQEREGEE
jgi:hypothetical protein